MSFVPLYYKLNQSTIAILLTIFSFGRNKDFYIRADKTKKMAI